MAVRVSVIVAVYNTGEYIEPLLASLREQTLPADEYEVILSDDGSTDEWTIARIDREAAERPNVVVLHEPNSGWPGRPRNLGLDIARGTYVFFADHDDWFGVEALQRMADYADECGSDVLVPRYAGHHRGVAKAMFGRSQPRATLESTPLMDSLTPHKLFRLEFLREQGLRFPEGRRRLEDHVFVVDAYFRAATISVLADYHCYFHVGRPDAGNAAYNRIDPPSYYKYVREVVDLIYAHTSPGALRDRLLRRPLRQEVLGRLDGAGLLTRPREHTRAVFDEGRALASELLPPSLDAGLSPPQRVRVALLRADRFDDLLAYVQHQASIKGRVRLTGLGWSDAGELVLDVAGGLVDGAPDVPLTYRRDGDALVLTEPVYSGGDPVRVRVDTGTSPLRSGNLQIVLRRRDDSEEWPVPTVSRQAISENGVLVSPDYTATGRFDPRTLGGGRLLTPGVWDVYAKVNQTGWSKEVRLGSLRSDAATGGRRPAILDGIPVTPYWTETYDNLSVDIGAADRFVRWAAPEVSGVDGVLRVHLAAVGTPPQSGRLVLRPAGGGAPISRPAPAGPDGDRWLLRAAVTGLPSGRFAVALGLDASAPPVDLGAELDVAASGAVRLEHPEPAPPPSPPPPPRLSTRDRVLASPAGPLLRRLRRRVRRLRARARR